MQYEETREIKEGEKIIAIIGFYENPRGAYLDVLNPKGKVLEKEIPTISRRITKGRGHYQDSDLKRIAREVIRYAPKP